VGWTIGSFGVGIVFPTIPVSVMGVVEDGREAGELSSTILIGYLGVGVGRGKAAPFVALADVGALSLEAGFDGRRSHRGTGAVGGASRRTVLPHVIAYSITRALDTPWPSPARERPNVRAQPHACEDQDLFGSRSSTIGQRPSSVHLHAQGRCRWLFIASSSSHL
jgi:hypothetical protein